MVGICGIGLIEAEETVEAGSLKNLYSGWFQIYLEGWLSLRPITERRNFCFASDCHLWFGLVSETLFFLKRLRCQKFIPNFLSLTFLSRVDGMR